MEKLRILIYDLANMIFSNGYFFVSNIVKKLFGFRARFFWWGKIEGSFGCHVLSDDEMEIYQTRARCTCKWASNIYGPIGVIQFKGPISYISIYFFHYKSFHFPHCRLHKFIYSVIKDYQHSIFLKKKRWFCT